MPIYTVWRMEAQSCSGVTFSSALLPAEEEGEEEGVAEGEETEEEEEEEAAGVSDVSAPAAAAVTGTAFPAGVAACTTSAPPRIRLTSAITSRLPSAISFTAMPLITRTIAATVRAKARD